MSSAKVNYEQLIAYAAGELSPEQAAQVQAYLRANPRAGDPIALYKQAQAAVQTDQSAAPPAELVAKAKAIFATSPSELAATWLDHLQQLIADLVFDSRAQPALAGYRGPATTFQLSFECDAANIDLEAEPIVGVGATPSEPAQWRIMGQVDWQGASSPAQIAMVDPGTENRVAEAIADEHGMFNLEAPAGRYDVLVQVDDKVVVLRNIEIQ